MMRAFLSVVGAAREKQEGKIEGGGGGLLVDVCGAVTFPHNFESVVSMSLSLFKAL